MPATSSLPPGATYECAQCDTLYPTLHTLKSHFYTAHVTPAHPSRQKPSQDGPVNSGDGLEDDSSDSDGSSSSSSGSSLSRPPPFKCEVKGCGKSFRQRKHRDRHEVQGHVSVHLRLNCMTCEVCGKVVDGGAKLREHMRVHGVETDAGGGSGEEIKCTVCDKAFRSASSLRRHLRRKNVHREVVVEGKGDAGGEGSMKKKRGRKKKIMDDVHDEEEDQDYVPEASSSAGPTRRRKSVRRSRAPAAAAVTEEEEDEVQHQDLNYQAPVVYTSQEESFAYATPVPAPAYANSGPFTSYFNQVGHGNNY